MQSTAEICKGLGPKLSAELTKLSAARDAARRRVTELQELRTQRLAERQTAQTPVMAGADPKALAGNLALAGALDSVIAEIDQELARATENAQRIGAPYHRLVELVTRKRKRLDELNQDIAELEAQRDRLVAELAA